MTMLSPAATFHAELREQLASVGRALSTQRALLWLTRGAAAGSVIVLGIVIWAWTRDGVSSLPLGGIVALPFVLGLIVALATLLVKQDNRELARRIDRAAHLQERSTTALELGARGDEFPLAVAQMRDAVEHLRRVDMLHAFPLRAPKNELLTIFFVTLIAVLVGVSPNPWLLRARASNPAITTAREEAQRVERLADSIQSQNPDIDMLRQLVSQGARTMDARSNEPDAALNALQDLEDQIRQMSAGDDQLASALSAIASALAQDPATQQLANAINTGDMRQIAQATKDLAQHVDQLSSTDKARVGQVLRDASGRATRSSQSVANELSAAASALQSNAGSDSSDPSASPYGQESASSGQYNQSAQDALNQLSDSAAAAGERQRAQSQLESSRNALERALGRTQSRSSSSSNSSGRSNSSSSGQRSQTSNGNGSADQGQNGSQGQTGDGSESGADSQPGGSSPGQDGSNGQTGEGSGYSTGGQSPTHTAGTDPSLDMITRPEQVPSNGQAQPDVSSVNPYLENAGQSSATTSDESVQPSYSRKPTQGNESGTIPLGLRDLVKDYFSSLDQNQ
ncbi:MAG: hypothetical protein JOZ81_21145, partial [Chloroflexi bacterium]|nr:hypothetical protein [Chloroflexota bacterium]